MVFDKVTSLCPNHFCRHSRKLYKEPFLLYHSHLTTSAFVTICLGTNIMNSNRRRDKSHMGENPCRNVFKSLQEKGFDMCVVQTFLTRYIARQSRNR